MHVKLNYKITHLMHVKLND